jgi:hypothetical protein
MQRATRLVSALVVLGCLWAAPAALAEDGPDDGTPSEIKRMLAMVKGMQTFVGDARLTEADVKALIEHGKSFHEIGKNEETEEDVVEQALEAKYAKDGVYDFELIFALPQVKAWAAARKVDARAWARSFMRVMSLQMRKQFATSAKDIEESLAEQAASIEEMREEMGEEAYKAAMQGIEQGRQMAKTMAAMVEKIPAPTESEAKLLATHGKALGKALDMDDDDDGEDDGEEDDDGDDEDR